MRKNIFLLYRRCVEAKGFTLLEVVVVLAILGILFSFTAPKLYAWKSANQLKLASETVQNDFLYARDLANREKDTYSLAFYPNTAKYNIRRGSDGKIIKRVQLENGVLIDRTTFNPYTAMANDFSFSTDGRAGLPIMGGTVVLRNPEGDYLYVIVSRNGRVRISETAPGVIVE